MSSRTAGTVKKSGRTAFNASDDAALTALLVEHTSNVKGNELYKALADSNGRHSWQSWRDRAVKTLLPRLTKTGQLDRERERVVAERAERLQNNHNNTENVCPPEQAVEAIVAPVGLKCSDTPNPLPPLPAMPPVHSNKDAEAEDSENDEFVDAVQHQSPVLPTSSFFHSSPSPFPSSPQQTAKRPLFDPYTSSSSLLTPSSTSAALTNPVLSRFLQLNAPDVFPSSPADKNKRRGSAADELVAVLREWRAENEKTSLGSSGSVKRGLEEEEESDDGNSIKRVRAEK
ncbi:hypothetical protein HDU79_002935 [Rhizoclosmatium sp. JEL0117]|nr:hypothetical protein HDU79_002935 [Rhizoclosmatium sp. JEL0117]